jgi:hypothetical protein
MKTVVLKAEHAIADLDRDHVNIIILFYLVGFYQTYIINSRSISTGLELKKYNMRHSHIGY